MSASQLVFPMFAMVVLAFFVVVRLFLSRTVSVRAGEVSADYFKTYQGAEGVARSAQLSRSFVNQFEVPVLFYAACLAAMVLAVDRQAFLVLAWLYVGLRWIHMFIHTGPNALVPRILAYFSSWLVLLTMWVVLVLEVTG